MANKMAASVNALVSFVLAILWIITLVRPWTWLWTENGIVMFKVNLFSIYVRRGTVGAVLSLLATLQGKSAVDSVTAFFNNDYWLDEGVSKLCLPHVNAIWAWCDSWAMAKYGSYIFLFFGLIAAAFLVMGGVFTYYYALVHATATGRTCIIVSFIVAPSVALLGLLQYSLMTFSILMGQREIIGTEASYGYGFFCACALTMLSVVPLALHVKFLKVDEFEKDGDDFEFGTNYGAAAGPFAQGFNGYPQTYMQSTAMYGASGSAGLPMYGNAGPQMFSAQGMARPPMF